VDGEENVRYYPNSSSMWLTLEQSRTVEWVCLSILTSFLILRLGRDGFEVHRFFYPGHIRFVHSLRCLLLVCLYTALITKNPRFSPFLRLVIGYLLAKVSKRIDISNQNGACTSMRLDACTAYPMLYLSHWRFNSYLDATSDVYLGSSWHYNCILWLVWSGSLLRHTSRKTRLFKFT
jgi:hypothetical protein